jgi:DNA-binding MarR family transcriptional regulator
LGSTSARHNAQEALLGESQQALEERLLWDVLSLSVNLMRISELWGKRIGVSGSQWMILMAIHQLGNGPGVSVKEVATFLNADASFVTTQSKILEKMQFVERIQSKHDRRNVLMSLTEMADEKLAVLAPSRARLQEFIRAELDDGEVSVMSEAISRMRARLEKAALLLAAGA